MPRSRPAAARTSSSEAVAAEGTRLAYDCEQRVELGIPPLRRVEVEPVRHRERQLDDVTAVRAGVRVVRLDHVAEQERGAAVRGRELHRVIDQRSPILREESHQSEYGQREEHQRRLVGGGEGEDEAEG